MHLLPIGFLGELNASYACLDAHINAGLADKEALVWLSEENNEAHHFTYAQLYDEVNRCAYVLQSCGVQKGDMVIIYMPMIPQSLMMMLACARLGATHSVVFSGFSSLALKDRIIDTQAQCIITADYAVRRGKKIMLKAAVNEAIKELSFVKKVITVSRGTQPPTPMMAGRDVLYNDVRPEKPVYVKPQPVESNHLLFTLYTSGTTGKPKGIMHSTGGYLTYVYSTFKSAFNPASDSIYFCTADIGWITGHSYVVYAPLMHGVTTVIYEGAPDYPNPGIWWKIIEQCKVTIFYTSPTALRMAIASGDSWPQQHNLTSLKTLGTVGEPINPDVWKWYDTVIGGSRCPIIDTWWQTETGGFMISPTPQQRSFKPGSATKPLPGIHARVLNEQGEPVQPNTKGYLVITKPWPGMSIGIYGDQERFKQVYWSMFPNKYYTGDYAVQDDDGDFWLLGRADEVLNVAGHRIGTAEIESASVSHPAVAEAAAVGIPDPLRGEAILLFVTLKHGVHADPTLRRNIIAQVRSHIGAFVIPQQIFFVKKLPKTRSGKIMRRILKGIVQGTQLGDLTTIEDEASVDEIKMYYDSLKTEMKNILDQ